MNEYNEYEKGCWEESTMDPLRDINRLPTFYDPFWELSYRDSELIPSNYEEDKNEDEELY